jgi:predicted helicase
VEQTHRVQILDPTIGTGAFLVETASQIREKVPHGIWNSYVKEHLIPRLNGFEVLMAPYVIAHINFARFLEQTGYKTSSNQRLRIFLTNSLRGASSNVQRRLSFFLDQEADEADRVKGRMPIMVVMGNPPYRGESQNTNEWIDSLIHDYKREPSGEKLRERNSKWINDDYVKFIRFGQMFVEKNGEGILAYISNHKFIENPTFRGMRWNLLRSFDTIYILDLHGDSKTQKPVSPDGRKDENVFDIQQGVSINIFIKTGRKKKGTMAKIFYYDIYGKRKEKYDFLFNTRFSDVPYMPVEPTAPYYFLKPRNEANLTEYEQGFRVDELISEHSFGCITAHDILNISFTENEQRKKIDDLLTMEEHQWREKYKRPSDSRDWTYQTAKRDAESNTAQMTTIAYRPFDHRITYYTGKSKGLYVRPLYKVMQHFLRGENIGLCIMRIGRDYNFSIFVTNKITDKTILSPKDNASIFFFFFYPDQDTLHNASRSPNFNKTIIEKIAQTVKIKFEPEKSNSTKKFAPIDILDYIYAVLHSPSYREKYKEFLKVDFPRVPYPGDAKTFWKLVKLGEKLRRLHLMEGVEPHQELANYDRQNDDEKSDNFVEKYDDYREGKVWINQQQFFDNVPPEVWNF